MRFRTLLEAVAAGLALPRRERRRILEELDADLEDLYAAYRAAGVPPVEAARRAADRLGPSPETVDDLVSLHAPLTARLAARLTSSAGGVEWSAFVAAALLTLAVAGIGLAPLDVLSGGDGFRYATLAAGSGALSLALAKAWSVVVRRDDRPAAILRHVDGLLALGAASPLIAALGALLELHHLAGRFATDASIGSAALLGWARQSSISLAVGLSVLVLSVLAWFALRRRAALIVDDESALAVADRFRLLTPHREAS
ncbi:MAG: permease prefix domain 1-containing protein [Longimicrobiales bacterium]